MLKGEHFAPTLSLILNFINSKDKKAQIYNVCKTNAYYIKFADNGENL